MTVAIIDYGSGNLRSVAKAFERASTPGTEIKVTSNYDEVLSADQIVLPGVGAFGDCMIGLAELDGMIPALNEAVIAKGRPFLGICVGMQLMASFGCEHGKYEGLQWVEGGVQKLTPADGALKIPHMGWNELDVKAPVHPVLEGLDTANTHVYFVHSFHFQVKDRSHLLATTDYGGEVAAVVGRDNLVGTQFHPEKSQGVGLKFIDNFLTWQP